MKVGLLHPGAMGASVGLALQANDHQVFWVAAGRSAQTRERASTFTALDDIEQLGQQVDAVLSVCPPESAATVSKAVKATGFAGLYIDANALAPQTAREIAADWPGRYVDGGIVGPPALQAGTTRLFLSGPDSASVSQWFQSGYLETQVLGEALDAASALKMCYAAYTKGQAAMLLAVCALSERLGVSGALFEEWARSQPKLEASAERSAAATAPKAWRFAGEMSEIAATFRGAGLPSGYHEAAEQTYAAMAELKSVDSADLAAVVRTLLAQS